MLSPGDTELQQSRLRATAAGHWQLAPGRALSLCPRCDGVLRITRGRAWLTLDVPPHGPAAEVGDHCLCAGEQLRVRAGRHLVFESLDPVPVDFEWLQLPVAVPLRVSRWNESVVLPLADLGRAASMAGRAAWRLLRGLASTALALLAGRPVLRS